VAAETAMFAKIVVILMLLLIVGSLFSGLFFLYRDGGRGRRTVRALTLRIVLSIILFVTLMAGFYLGLLGPGLQFPPAGPQ
jgi:hypothetical protein